jgi:bisphosphoglycerate-independent phosphoglycerate mutase (AlkP superfamily)
LGFSPNSQKGDYLQALADRTTMEAVIKNASDINLMDVRTFHGYAGLENDVTDFLNLASTRSALNVGEHRFVDGSDAVSYKHLHHVPKCFAMNDCMSPLAFPVLTSNQYIALAFVGNQFFLFSGWKRIGRR